MAIYSVIIARPVTITEQATLEIEAETEEKAGLEALRLYDAGDQEIFWFEDDCSRALVQPAVVESVDPIASGDEIIVEGDN
jgi:hypothetical protein